ncbi:MAG: hypothetical protein U0793_25755 [Gemmataceae bacterium]
MKRDEPSDERFEGEAMVQFFRGRAIPFDPAKNLRPRLNRPKRDARGLIVASENGSNGSVGEQSDGRQRPEDDRLKRQDDQ